jgi:hypothetical protein
MEKKPPFPKGGETIWCRGAGNQRLWKRGRFVAYVKHMKKYRGYRKAYVYLEDNKSPSTVRVDNILPGYI